MRQSSQNNCVLLEMVRRASVFRPMANNLLSSAIAANMDLLAFLTLKRIITRLFRRALTRTVSRFGRLTGQKSHFYAFLNPLNPTLIFSPSKKTRVGQSWCMTWKPIKPTPLLRRIKAQVVLIGHTQESSNCCGRRPIKSFFVGKKRVGSSCTRSHRRADRP